ncbi:hypothetical protein Tco_0208546, partial [Tanacetum coccineum]
MCLVVNLFVKEKDLNEEPVAMEEQSPLVDQTNPMKTGGDHIHHYLHRELIRLETPQISLHMLMLLVNRSIRAISERFVNTAYGFFLGKRVAYPVVANYVRNTWVESECDLLKEDVQNVLVWVKLHGVPITAFSEDGLSAIAMKVG